MKSGVDTGAYYKKLKKMMENFHTLRKMRTNVKTAGARLLVEVI
ncbi:hypothetical protein [Blautia segnis]|nr:hypothetical protein [Blautia segnis]